jgi:hypothetical protein
MPSYIRRTVFCALIPWAASLAGTIGGSALSKGGAPVPKVKIILARHPGGLSGLQVTDSAVTDSLGRYAFKHLSAGHWHLSAAPAGYLAANASASLGDSGETAAADLILRPGSGLSKSGSVTGRVRDAAGAALRGAKVVLSKQLYSQTQAAPKPQAVAAAVTDSVGRFLFDSLDFQADYMITASASGYAPAADSQVSVAMGQTLTRIFDLEKEAGKKKAPERAGKKLISP